MGLHCAGWKRRWMRLSSPAPLVTCLLQPSHAPYARNRLPYMIPGLCNPRVTPGDFTVQDRSGGGCVLARRHLSHASFSPRRGPLRHLPPEDRLPYMIPGLWNPGVRLEGSGGGGGCVLGHRHLLSLPPSAPAAALSGTSRPKRGCPTHVPRPCLRPGWVLKGSLCRLGAVVGASYLA